MDKDFSYPDYANWFFALPVIISFLLIAPIDMVSNKFQGAGFKGNEMRYMMMALALILVLWLKTYAFAPAILIYIAISITATIFKKITKE